MKKISINITDFNDSKLRELSETRGATYTSLVNTAIENYLNQLDFNATLTKAMLEAIAKRVK
jgi:predicted DNA-binding protein